MFSTKRVLAAQAFQAEKAEQEEQERARIASKKAIAAEKKARNDRIRAEKAL